MVSLARGRPRDLDFRGSAWRSGIYKAVVAGPVRVGLTNLEGDGQADLRFHGGPDRAVLAYSADHYPAWRDELRALDLPFGAFGENLTIAGSDEATVCVGDVVRVGSTRLQVSQPRLPCWKLGRRFGIPDLPRRVLVTRRGGWYMRVLEEGVLEAGDVVELIDRPFPEWNVRRAIDVYLAPADDGDRSELAALPLSELWLGKVRRGERVNAVKVTEDDELG